MAVEGPKAAGPKVATDAKTAADAGQTVNNDGPAKPGLWERHRGKFFTGAAAIIGVFSGLSAATGVASVACALVGAAVLGGGTHAFQRLERDGVIKRDGMKVNVDWDKMPKSVGAWRDFFWNDIKNVAQTVKAAAKKGVTYADLSWGDAPKVATLADLKTFVGLKKGGAHPVKASGATIFSELPPEVTGTALVVDDESGTPVDEAVARLVLDKKNGLSVVWGPDMGEGTRVRCVVNYSEPGKDGTPATEASVSFPLERATIGPLGADVEAQAMLPTVERLRADILEVLADAKQNVSKLRDAVPLVADTLLLVAGALSDDHPLRTQLMAARAELETASKTDKAAGLKKALSEAVRPLDAFNAFSSPSPYLPNAAQQTEDLAACRNAQKVLGTLPRQRSPRAEDCDAALQKLANGTHPIHRFARTLVESPSLGAKDRVVILAQYLDSREALLPDATEPPPEPAQDATQRQAQSPGLADLLGAVMGQAAPAR